jgi:hypothetical protein
VAGGALIVLEARAAGFRPLRHGPVFPGEGAFAPVILRLEPGFEVAGVVRASDGRPIGGAAIEAHQGDGWVFDGRSDAAGAFVLDGLAPGHVRLLARHDLHAQTMLDLQGPASGVVLTMAPVTTVRGRVVPATPGLQAVVRIDGVGYRSPVDDDGCFRIHGVGRGRARLDIETADERTLAFLWLDLWSQDGEVVVRLP